MKMFLFMCVAVIISFCMVNCEPGIGDFFGKIPDQMGTAWSTLKAVIKEPIRPARLGKIGKLKTTTTVTNVAVTTTAAPATVTHNMAQPHYSWRHVGKSLNNVEGEKGRFIFKNYEMSPFEDHGSQHTYRVIIYDEEVTTLSDRHRVHIPHLVAPVAFDFLRQAEKNREATLDDHFRATRSASPTTAEVIKYMYGGFTRTPLMRTLIED